MAKAGSKIINHDYRADKTKKGVSLIVRHNNKYGEAVAGDIVLVDETELDNASTMSCCMTGKDQERLKKARAKRDAEAKENKDKRSLKRMVEDGIKRLTGVEVAKDRGIKETLEAEKLEAEQQLREAAVNGG